MIRYVVLAVALLIPTWAQGANLFTEDFESSLATLQAKYECSYSSPTPFTDGAAQDWDTAQKYAGTYSLKQNYTGSQYANPPQGGGHCLYRFVDQTQSEIWITWYHRFGTGFITGGENPNPVLSGSQATKSLYLYMWSPTKSQENGWVFHYFYGGRQLTLSAQGIKDHKGPNGPGTGTAVPYDTENMWQNVQALEEPDNQWTCYEANFKLNTPGQADGRYLLYSTNMSTGGSPVLRTSKTGREFIDDNPYGRMPSDARWYVFKFYRQDGLGDMWYDNAYVDTTRRGCSGAPPPSDTTPPAQVTGLTAASDTATSITYTWTASSATDLQSYIVRGCTPGACTNFATVGTRPAGTTTFTWQGLAANTLYRLQVAAQDTSGNLGTFSSIVDETTDAASVLPTVTAFSTTATGGQITYTGTPTDFRIAFGGTNGDGSFWNSQIIRTLAQVPGGALSFNWPLGTSWACAHARDAVAAEDAVGYRCNSVTPAPPGGSTSSTFLRKLSSNPRWLTLDGTTAIYRVGISGGDNCNASFCGLQDQVSSNTGYGYVPVNLITSTTITDTFDGTASDLGPLWDAGYTGSVAFTKVSGVAQSVGGTNAVESRSDYIYGNQFAKATLQTFGGTGWKYLRVAVNMSAPPTLNGYACYAMKDVPGAYTSAIDRMAAGTGTWLVSESATTWTTGDTIECKRVGKFIYLLRNGSVLLTAEDATYRDGRVGMVTYADTPANATVTNFTGGPIVHDYVTALDALVTAGSNWVRYWTMEQSRYGTSAVISAGDEISIPYDQFPYQWTGTTRTDTSTGVSLAVPVYDLLSPNQAFYDRVVARVDAALARGITPIITMFSGGHLAYPGMVSGFSNPFYGGNNTNGVSCDANGNGQCEEAHTLSNGNINNAQRQYVDRLVQALGNRPVILEVTNEDQTDSTLWQNMIMERVRTAEATYSTNAHVIFQSGWFHGTNYPAGGASNAHLFSNHRNDAISPLCTSDGVNYETNPPASDGTKLVFYDNDHTGWNGVCAGWTKINPWKLFTRAIYPIYLSEWEDAPTQALIKTAMAQTNLYSTKINLATAYPETGTSIFSTGYGLFTGTNSTTPNCSDYLMLMPSDGSSTINLTACGTGATFTIEYLNLTSGAVTSGGTVNGGASRSFNPAGTDPMVVLLKSYVPADTTPPVVSGGSPTGVLASGTASVSMIVITNENATCKYGTVAATAYASIASTFSTTGGTTHSQTIAGLVDGNTYTYYVRCQDVAGNPNVSDYTVAWSVTALAPDVAPPIRTVGAPSGVLIHTTTSVSMTLTTNETAACKYGTIAATAYASIANTFSTTGGTSHSQTIAVSQGNTYTYYVRCTDGTNPNVDDYTIAFQVAASPDVTPPVIINCATNPAGVLPAGTTSVTITCTTDENSTVKMDPTFGTAYASMATTFGTTGTTSHSQSVGGLADGTSYTRYVRATDGTNPTTTDYVVSWSVAAAAVTVTPADVTNVRGTLDEAAGTILWQWDAVSGASSYLLEISLGDVFLTAVESSANSGTIYTQSNLTVGTYTARIKAINGANQQSANWAGSVPVVTELPPTVTGVTVSSNLSSQVVLSFTAPSQSSLVSIVERAPTGCATWTLLGAGATNSFTDNTVAANTLYCYRVKFSNPVFGGTSAAWSDTVQVTTPAVVSGGLIRPRTPLPFGVYRLPRN